MTSPAHTPRERPILFSAPMVRAILEGGKTQTRRAMKPQPQDDGLGLLWGPGKHQRMGWSYAAKQAGQPHPDWLLQCPYGRVGDLLWVREGFVEDVVERPPYDMNGHPTCEPVVRYRADNDEDHMRWRSPIHMPRWASRITLRTTDVRVERLKDISASDCCAEGCQRPDRSRCLGSEVTIRDSARNEYRAIWESINGPGSWALNPWVWAVSFERITPGGSQ